MTHLQAAIAAELPLLRAEVRVRMVDTFEIRTPPVTRYDDFLKENVETSSLLFTTPGYIGRDKLQPSEAQVGDRTSTTVRKGIRIPWDSPAVPADVVAKCVAIGPLTPPRLLNRVYRVQAAEDATNAIYCNLIITETLS